MLHALTPAHRINDIVVLAVEVVQTDSPECLEM